MPRPWYRSRLFGLGLLPLVFLLWAWRDAAKYDTSYAWNGPADYLTIWQGPSGVGWMRADKSKASVSVLFQNSGGFERESCEVWSYQGVPQWVGLPFAAPRPFWKQDDKNGWTLWGGYLPHWLLVGAWSCVWLGALAGWQRYKRRETSAVGE